MKRKKLSDKYGIVGINKQGKPVLITHKELIKGVKKYLKSIDKDIFMRELRDEIIEELKG